MIRALIFDCFGVFYVDPVFAYMHEPSTSPDKANALHSLDEQAARGMITKATFTTQAAELLGLSHGAIEEQFFHGQKRDVHLLEFVQTLRSSYKVALLSNIGGDMMDGYFSPDERQQFFDVTVLSGDVRLAKPDKAIFELTCEKLGVALNEAIMIDDMQSTCTIVKEYGMQSIWYRDFGQFRAELNELIR